MVARRLASANGTKVDDAGLDGVVLKGGDILGFGNVDVRFV